MSIVSPGIHHQHGDNGITAGRMPIVPGFSETCVIDGDDYFRIPHVDRIEPFFMSLLSSDDHWMFVASNGALSCGRRNPQRSLFPYYSSDKLLDLRESTGPKTIFRVWDGVEWTLWEPFSGRLQGEAIDRHLYKNSLGTRLIFEECHHHLGLTFRYQWAMGRRFGFVRTAHLQNLNAQEKIVEVLDGFQNIVPGGVDSQFQLRFSNLLDAYKKSEVSGAHRIGVYYLSSIPTDRAEPSEGLLASVAWSTGLGEATVLLSDRQFNAFRNGRQMGHEVDLRGRKGHYFVTATATLPGHGHRSWKLVADVHQEAGDLVSLAKTLETAPDIDDLLDEDVKQGEEALLWYAAQADGVQMCRQGRRAGRHVANVLFNMMRGGVPLSAYAIDGERFVDHLFVRNRAVHARHAEMLRALPQAADMHGLVAACSATGDADLSRLAAEYLPLTLSRRHGDPTRPWNFFDIRTRTPLGQRRVGFEGNWRDIFQNWEALGFSYPHLLPAMILRFVNASTADGYNPYRISEEGFDWERPDAADAWSNYGYWGDHQIVYLLKLLEQAEAALPDRVEALFRDETGCVYADLPYRIHGFAEIVRKPRATIDYDFSADRAIGQRVALEGSDGQLARDRSGAIHHVSLLEKLLVSGCVKLANFVPDAGIWLNTQRPEWNDAQNALAGLGASLVTTSYLRRYLVFLRRWVDRIPAENVSLSEEVTALVAGISRVLADSARERDGNAPQRWRYRVVEQLQGVAEAHRRAVYQGFSGARLSISRSQISKCLTDAIECLTNTLRRSRRADGLYHSFNVLEFGEGVVSVENLEEMLEGQVAILESGILTPAEASELLAALRASSLYRPDQRSYLLYPDRDLPRFDEKNRISARAAEAYPAVMRFARNPDQDVLLRDVGDDLHFAGRLRNVADLNAAVDRWNDGHIAEALSEEERAELCRLWEETFQHRRFTGRATRFFGYEGLGSVYWHMVSKLAYAVARECVSAHEAGAPVWRRLVDQFRDINEGMWLEKTPEAYGAFPTDPYSHTPAHAGAQQPGMTGQVKEDILTRFLELGVRTAAGRIRFAPGFLRDDEFLETPGEFRSFSDAGNSEALALPAGSLAFTICNVPVVYSRAPGGPALRIQMATGEIRSRDVAELTFDESQSVFLRSGSICRIDVTVGPCR
jgi:hypothetical protein